MPYSIRTQVARGRREEAVGNRALDRPSPSKVLSLSITCDPAVHVQRSALDCILLIHPRPDPCSVKCPQHLFRTIFVVSTWCPKHFDPRVHPLQCIARDIQNAKLLEDPVVQDIKPQFNSLFQAQTIRNQMPSSFPL